MSYSSSSASSSTSTLATSKMAKTSYVTPKNYEAAFGTLSSSFGLGSTVPSLPPKSTKMRSSASHKSAPSLSPSSASSLPFTTPSTSSPKDYEAAFGALSSSYGWGPSVPVLPSRTEKSHSNENSRKVSPGTATPSYSASSAPSPKNYEDAFCTLSTSYGYSSGGVAVAFQKS